jgi:SAM-dependent methyltransferase
MRLFYPVIWNALADEWELTPRLRRLMDLREGTICLSCSANARTMHLVQTLLADTGLDMGGLAASDLRIAEINEVPGLHSRLRGMPGLTYSEYGSESSQDLMALTYDDEAFDYILTSDTLEHVPDFDLALSEVRRVLKPDGKHIFTIPVIWERGTRNRKALPPSYHGGPKANDSLVIHEFGGDVVERIANAGFDVEVRQDPKNALVSTFLCTKSLASTT